MHSLTGPVIRTVLGVALGTLVLGGAASAATPSGTQPAREVMIVPLASGSKIRVLSQDQVLQGRYLGQTGATLRLEVDGKPVEIPVDGEHAILMKRQRAMAGLYKGGVVGGALGLFSISMTMVALGEGEVFLRFGALAGLAVGTAIGAGVGGLVGTGIGALANDWIPVYDPAGLAPPRVRRLGSVTGQLGFGGYLDREASSSGGGVAQVALYVWGGQVFAIGPQVGFQALGDGRRLLWDSVQIRLSTPTRPFSVYGIGGAGAYVTWRASSRHAAALVGLNFGAGVRYAARDKVLLSAELRVHTVSNGWREGSVGTGLVGAELAF